MFSLAAWKRAQAHSRRNKQRGAPGGAPLMGKFRRLSTGTLPGYSGTTYSQIEDSPREFRDHKRSASGGSGLREMYLGRDIDSRGNSIDLEESPAFSRSGKVTRSEVYEPMRHTAV